ncbi:hypothetical protein CPAV1605_1445 [seawater metagenome]|uniref:Uncharacterized protein n=1 Tax=seawater metagenome TaxID=1561972 RepID=A0A5E8CMJ9_9ZZZZ
MGYTTNFYGEFKLNTTLDKNTADLIKGIATTRRMKRSIPILAKKFNISEELALLKFGIDGEFYFDKGDFCNFGQSEDSTIIDINTPPKRQPSLWCQWYYFETTNSIKWDEGEKFYNYIEWIKYIINVILEPRKYKVTGTVNWQGEDDSDKGTIAIKDNLIDIF